MSKTFLTPTTNGHCEPDLIPAPWDSRVGGFDENGDPNWPVFDTDQHDEKILSAFFSSDLGTYVFIFIVILGGILLLGSLVVAFLTTL